MLPKTSLSAVWTFGPLGVKEFNCMIFKLSSSKSTSKIITPRSMDSTRLRSKFFSEGPFPMNIFIP
jgi:hypothetical protein